MLNVPAASPPGANVDERPCTLSGPIDPEPETPAAVICPNGPRPSKTYRPSGLSVPTYGLTDPAGNVSVP